jgi:Zn-dependent protease/CBS domain-containing protein
MGASIRLGRIRGIPIGLHISWFLIFVLVTWSLASGYFPQEYPKLSVAAYWILGAITSILFFGSVLAHELGHSIIALRNQVPVNGITLFIFGGVAQIGQEPPNAGAEFRIAIAGPLTSLALGAVFGLTYLLDRAIPFLAAPSIWLMRINLILALFNMIPGFPLDGGRVLRAAIWGVTGDYHRATQIASSVGQVTAFGFIGVGILTVLGDNFFNGLWLVLIGWFLQNAAANSYAQSNMQHALRGIHVAQVMSRECIHISGDTPLNSIVEDRILGTGQRCFFITGPEGLQGMLSLRDVTEVPKDEWNSIQVSQVMVPTEKLIYVNPQTELIDALRTMVDANINQVPVIENGHLAGVLSREQILGYVRTRAELGV